LYGPGRNRRDSASEDESEDSELEIDDGEYGEPGDSLESEDGEEVVPLDGLDSFAADVLAFSTEEVDRANLVSLRILRNFSRSLRARSRRLVALNTVSGREEDDSPPSGSTLTLVLLFVFRRYPSSRASESMSSWRIASTFEIRVSFTSANERLVACWGVRRRHSVSTFAIRLSASSGWPEAAALKKGDPKREPPRVLALRAFQ